MAVLAARAHPALRPAAGAQRTRPRARQGGGSRGGAPLAHLAVLGSAHRRAAGAAAAVPEPAAGGAEAGGWAGEQAGRAVAAQGPCCSACPAARKPPAALLDPARPLRPARLQVTPLIMKLQAVAWLLVSEDLKRRLDSHSIHAETEDALLRPLRSTVRVSCGGLHACCKGARAAPAARGALPAFGATGKQWAASAAAWRRHRGGPERGLLPAAACSGPTSTWR